MAMAGATPDLPGQVLGGGGVALSTCFPHELPRGTHTRHVLLDTGEPRRVSVGASGTVRNRREFPI